jgi:hypothetical protein
LVTKESKKKFCWIGDIPRTPKKALAELAQQRYVSGSRVNVATKLMHFHSSKSGWAQKIHNTDR